MLKKAFSRLLSSCTVLMMIAPITARAESPEKLPLIRSEANGYTDSAGGSGVEGAVDLDTNRVWHGPHYRHGTLGVPSGELQGMAGYNPVTKKFDRLQLKLGKLYTYRIAVPGNHYMIDVASLDVQHRQDNVVGTQFTTLNVNVEGILQGSWGSAEAGGAGMIGSTRIGKTDGKVLLNEHVRVRGRLPLGQKTGILEAHAAFERWHSMDSVNRGKIVEVSAGVGLEEIAGTSLGAGAAVIYDWRNDNSNGVSDPKSNVRGEIGLHGSFLAL